MKLKQYLELSKKEEKEAAFELGVKQPVLNRWVTGARKPRSRNLNDIYKWSNRLVTPNDFYLDEKEEGDV